MTNSASTGKSALGCSKVPMEYSWDTASANKNTARTSVYFIKGIVVDSQEAVNDARTHHNIKPVLVLIMNTCIKTNNTQEIHDYQRKVL